MFSRYVALGDSQTEGMNDPDGHGGLRGWADRLADILAEHNPDLGYANLAVRGLRTRAIRTTQLEAAIALQPDLATVMAGANDVLGGFDLEATIADIEAMYAGLREAGATVVGCTFPDMGFALPFGRRLSGRIRALNVAVRAAARRQGALLVDCARYPALADLRWWSEDRLHLNPRGHQRLALAYAHALGASRDVSWQEPLPRLRPHPAWRRVAEDTVWLGRYFVPWLHRHLRHISTGDGHVAKRPTIAPWRAPTVEASASEQLTSSPD